MRFDCLSGAIILGADANAKPASRAQAIARVRA